MPVMAGPEMTEAAIADCLAQTVHTQILVINQGVDSAFRDHLERLAEEQPHRILVWSHDPPMLSLSASWNRALDFVWATGEQKAFVVNNDVRLHPETVLQLDRAMFEANALFVSAVGVTKEQFNEGYLNQEIDALLTQRGGPDFSCYLISKACHDTYRFDEEFIPAFCEDLDYHRRLMLGGASHRIFSVNLPYLHLASQTLKQSPKRDQIGRAIERGSRAHYLKKWGGPVNAETFYVPYNRWAETGANTPEELLHVTTDELPGPTSPALQAHFQERYERVKDLL